jgi:type IV pilus assembly protein PilF
MRPGTLAILWALLLSGCVTETTGGLPEPADATERVQAQLDLARGYLGNRDYTRARGPLNRALEIDPRSVEAHVLMAVLYQGEDERELAEQHYKLALRYEPNNSQALNNYASFLYREQRYDEALGLLRVLVNDTEYPARSQAYENLGLAELIAGDREAARKAFARALNLNFAQPRSSLELAEMSYSDGAFELAHEYYEAFRVRARQSPRSLCLGMKISEALGDGDQRASYGLALQNLYPESAEAGECEIP